MYCPAASVARNKGGSIEIDEDLRLIGYISNQRQITSRVQRPVIHWHFAMQAQNTSQSLKLAPLMVSCDIALG